METLIIAHRGGAGLWPENTALAFDRALQIGCDGLELDLHLSGDGVLMVHHDPELRPDSTMQNGAWLDAASGPLRIDALTSAELAAFDVGQCRPDSVVRRKHPERADCPGLKIPEFADMLNLAARQTRKRLVMAELKTEGSKTSQEARERLTEIYARRIEGFPPDRIVTLSFDWRCLTHLAKTLPAPQLGFATPVLSQDPEWEKTFKGMAGAGAAAWSGWHENITRETVARARGLGLKIFGWTVNRPEDMRRLFQLGIDGLITDRPDLALAERAKSRG